MTINFPKTLLCLGNHNPCLPELITPISGPAPRRTSPQRVFRGAAGAW